jgi:metal-responsive CopG/Arc/MetJ family transcriptional regulator
MGRFGDSGTGEQAVIVMQVEAVRISVRFEPALLAVLDDHRRQLEDIPSRAEAIRKLCEQALAANGTSVR